MSGHDDWGHARLKRAYGRRPLSLVWQKQVRKWPDLDLPVEIPQRCAGPECTAQWDERDFPNHKYCTRRCEGGARRVRDAIVWKEDRVRPCAICGADLFGHRSDARYCGKACLRRGQRLRKKLMAERDGMSVPDIPLLASDLTWQDRDQAMRLIRAYSDISARISRL